MEGVIEPATIIALDTPNGATEQCGHVIKEVREWRMCQIYNAKGKSMSSECNHRG
jgi:hypothetical protein